MVAPTGYDTPLGTRTALANKNNASAYISIHYNAGGGEGVETYHYPGSASGKKLAALVHKHVKGGTAQKDRGVKSANFQVLRETRMPACLVEYGFMDSPDLREARLMIDPKFQLECAIETAKGICEYFGVKYVPVNQEPTVPTPSTMYDLSYMKDFELIGIRSSKHTNEICERVADYMEANANCMLLLKRGFDLRLLQKMLNTMYPDSR